MLFKRENGKISKKQGGREIDIQRRAPLGERERVRNYKEIMDKMRDGRTDGEEDR